MTMIAGLKWNDILSMNNTDSMQTLNQTGDLMRHFKVMLQPADGGNTINFHVQFLDVENNTDITETIPVDLMDSAYRSIGDNFIDCLCDCLRNWYRHSKIKLQYKKQIYCIVENFLTCYVILTMSKGE